MQPILALSVRQPSAERVILGTKRVEHRSIRTNIKERVYIYASQKVGSVEGEELPRGVIIGTVEVWKCSGTPGDYRWHLREPKRLARPRRSKGKPQPVWFNPFP